MEVLHQREDQYAISSGALVPFVLANDAHLQ